MQPQVGYKTNAKGRTFALTRQNGTYAAKTIFDRKMGACLLRNLQK